MKTEGGERVHPIVNDHGIEAYGISMREYFAAQAMQGILANRTYDPPRRTRIEGMAKDAVSAADALIEALNAK